MGGISDGRIRFETNAALLIFAVVTAVLVFASFSFVAVLVAI
jgi:hypothetical protein